MERLVENELTLCLKLSKEFFNVKDRSLNDCTMYMLSQGGGGAAQVSGIH